MKRKIIVRITSILIVLSIVIGCIVIYLKLTSSVSDQFEKSETKRYALALANKNEILKNLIGFEIYEDTLRKSNKRKGQIKLNIGFEGINLGHDAVDMEIPIKGEIGDATILLKANKKGGIWVYETINANVIANDTIINLKPKNQ